MTIGRGARVAALAALSAAGACFVPASYGPEVDTSGFVSAKLVDGNRVVFSFQHVTYKPAQGLSAFPDGGTPKYTNDEMMIGVYDLLTGAMHLILREKNARWISGQGQFFISQANGSIALVSRAGAMHDVKGFVNENYLLDADDGSMWPVKYREVLTAKGQKSQIPYMVSPPGYLVLVTSQGANRHDEHNGQIWVRAPDDTYHLVAESQHYVGAEHGDVIYWIQATREFKAFNMVTYQTRSLPDYRQHGAVDVTEGVTVGAKGERLQIGRKTYGSWTYTALPITKEQVLNAEVAK